MYRCKYCRGLVYADERRTHSCENRDRPGRPTGNEEDDFEYIPDPQRNSRNFFQECSAIAVERIGSMINASLLGDGQPHIPENRRPHQQLRFPIVFRPTIIVPANASLGNRGGSSITSQTANIPPGNPEAGVLSGSKQGAEIYVVESPKSTTGDSAKKLIKKGPAPAFRRIQLEFLRQTAGSNQPQNTSAEDDARASARTMFIRFIRHPSVPTTPMETKPLSNRCKPPMGSSRLPSPQVNRVQPSTTGVAHVSRRLAEGPPQGASPSPKRRSTLTFYCRVCQTNFATFENLDRHIDRLVEEGATNAMAHHHSPNYRREGFFVCVICQARFDTRSELNVHSEIHIVHMPFRCLHCKKGYIWEGFLTKHENEKHPRITIYRCQYCQKRFHSEIDLKHHHCEAFA